MTDRFEVLTVDDWAAVEAESAGGDEKVWLEQPGGTRWLFKPRTEHDNWAQGEDWAEKLAAEIARRLGVPAAHVELAVRGGRRGSISRNLVSPGWELQPGALLISEVVPDYEPRSRTRAGHSLDSIASVLEGVSPPAGAPPHCTAFEVFSGFLLLDALVANQDRHEENWAVLRPLPGAGRITLAPSFDHGSSLGFNLRDDKRLLEVGRSSVPAWACKATAQRFDRASDGMLTLVALALRALSRCTAPAREQWLAALEALSPSELGRVVAAVPEMSDATRTFTSELLLTNRRRLLDAHDQPRR
jgi:hypothetical protein